MMKIAPSLLSADFSCLRSELSKVEAAGADMVHLDIMDGHFVPPITIGPLVVEAIRPYTKLIFDAHLMVANPERHLESFKKAGADIITVHAETVRDLKKTITDIKNLGVRAGVAINPETPESAVLDVLEMADMILIMTVHPGYGGQKYIEGSERKVKAVRDAATKLGINLDIEVDGGINTETIGKVISAGANVIVTGSAFFTSENPVDFISKLRGGCV